MHYRISNLVFTILMFLSAAASAGTVICSGTVDVIAYHADDTFMIQLSSMNTPVFFCSSEQEWAPVAGFSTGPATCKALFAMFLTAKSTATPVNNVVFDSNDAPANCNAWEAWKQVNIRHFLY